MKVRITSKAKAIEATIIFIASLILLYLLISLYFSNHFFSGTTINGVRVSFRSYNASDRLISTYIDNYKLILLERNGVTEEISGEEIGLRYNINNNIKAIFKLQNQLLWPQMLFKKKSYYIEDLILYNDRLLKDAINRLNCFNKDIVEPRDVSFVYSKGVYNILKEVDGNKVNKEKLTAILKDYILAGKNILDLNREQCYYKPKYTLNSDKTLTTRDILNKYVSAKITYKFDNKYELIDGNVINRWLSVDDRLEVEINEKAIIDFIKRLANKYDTVGINRSFITSTGKTVEVAGGLYGWKINQKAETKALIDNINSGEIIQKEPVYEQKAVSRKDNDIGNSYIEINITRQQLWFYKDGKLISHGYVVTGNPGKGNATVTGTYFVIYKEKDSVLSGPGYDAKVTYWMPFFGNMGLHDATWRTSFGGQIYKHNGTHGCVNAPFKLAKTVFENIEEGIPVVIYEE